MGNRFKIQSENFNFKNFETKIVFNINIYISRKIYFFLGNTSAYLLYDNIFRKKNSWTFKIFLEGCS